MIKTRSEQKTETTGGIGGGGGVEVGGKPEENYIIKISRVLQKKGVQKGGETGL